MAGVELNVEDVDGAARAIDILPAAERIANDLAVPLMYQKRAGAVELDEPVQVVGPLAAKGSVRGKGGVSPCVVGDLQAECGSGAVELEMEVAEEEVAVRDVDAVHEVDRNVCRVAVFGLAHAQPIAAGRWAELRDLWRPICGAASQCGLARCGADQRKNDDQRKKEISTCAYVLSRRPPLGQDSAHQYNPPLVSTNAWF